MKYDWKEDAIYHVLIVSLKSIMSEWTNSRVYNALAWAAVVLKVGLAGAPITLPERDILY